MRAHCAAGIIVLTLKDATDGLPAMSFLDEV